MKIVVFAHVPPPFHGQSYMVELMLRGLRGDLRAQSSGPFSSTTSASETVECYHVDARFSDEMAGVGRFRLGKVLRLFGFCVQAIWCRLRCQADVFYYVPAPPRRLPFLRDCLVLALCRPFFRRTVFHWHASGLSEWLAAEALPVEQSLGRWFLSRPDLSFVLGESCSADAVAVRSCQIFVVPNGIPDPCPDFARTLLPARRERLARCRAALDRKTGLLEAPRYEVLFLAHLTREKGLFDSLGAVTLANRQLAAEGSPLRLRLTVAGSFQSEPEEAEFEEWRHDHADEVRFLGFVEGPAKSALLRECDCLCFPSYYFAEAQPIAIIEALAVGLNVVASRWRGIPEILSAEHPFLVPVRDPAAIARALIASVRSDQAASLRARYCEEFTDAKYLARLRSGLAKIISPALP